MHVQEQENFIFQSTVVNLKNKAFKERENYAWDSIYDLLWNKLVQQIYTYSCIVGYLNKQITQQDTCVTSFSSIVQFPSQKEFHTTLSACRDCKIAIA